MHNETEAGIRAWEEVERFKKQIGYRDREAQEAEEREIAQKVERALTELRTMTPPYRCRVSPEFLDAFLCYCNAEGYSYRIEPAPAEEPTGAPLDDLDHWLEVIQPRGYIASVRAPE
jgi:glutamine synthetase